MIKKIFKALAFGILALCIFALFFGEIFIDFLTNNASNWEIEGDTILFSNDELVNEYNGYINEIDALAEAYESYNL